MPGFDVQRGAASDQPTIVCLTNTAPMALVKHRVYAGFRMTSHPVVKSIVESHGTWEKMPVVKDRNLITSQGPGTAIAFGLMLIEHLEGIDKAAEVRAPLMIPNV